MGGLDVFHSTLQPDGSWSEPENLGYPVNTTGDDIFFNPGWTEMESYYAIRRDDDPSSSTINMALKLEYEEEELLADLPGTKKEMDQPEVIIPMTIAETTSSTETSTEAILVEPPNTDEIEMVLNERRPEVEPVYEPEGVSEEIPLEVSTPLEPSAFTNSLTTLVPFITNKYELGMAAQLEVEKIAELMMYSPDSKVELIGHTDSTGDEDFNMLLSLYRSEKVAEYLEMRGIERDRIKVDGQGEATPIAINSFSDGSDALLGRYLNRQVFVRITGDLPVDSKLCGVYVPANLIPAVNSAEARDREYHFTIQLMAVSAPLSDSYFANLSVNEYACKDGLYRYTSSSFRTFQEAKQRLLHLRKQGYPDAFIQTREWYDKAAQ
jgi:outer membrane protein OmpA-like peptidoglycan-associated protein